jgi:hypothetical protein
MITMTLIFIQSCIGYLAILVLVPKGHFWSLAKESCKDIKNIAIEWPRVLIVSNMYHDIFLVTITDDSHCKTLTKALLGAYDFLQPFLLWETPLVKKKTWVSQKD